LKGVLAAVTVALLAGCSTPCDVSGRLCAPFEANTRPLAEPQYQQRSTAPAEPAIPEAEVQTMPVDSPDQPQPEAAAPTGKTVRIGLMLPLRSAALGKPADILRAGFMAAHAHEGAGYVVDVIDSGDGPQQALEAYARAAENNDIVVGPLARSDVSAVASSPALRKPTIALNHPDAGTLVPPNMIVIGLSIEDEARQAAAWISREQPGASAIIVTGPAAWQHRIANAFADEWIKLGHNSEEVELPTGNGYQIEMAIGQLNSKVQDERPTLIFAALDAVQARQVRGVLGNGVPFYGSSSVNPRPVAGDTQPELDGVRMLDLPWVMQRDDAAVAAYRRFDGSPLTLDMERVYALGIDAFCVAREIAKGRNNFELDGVTGKLKGNYGNGSAQFSRTMPVAVYQGGAARMPAAGQ
ncbi:penicillin-binding protein activator, partial [Massilia cavernae]